MNKYAGVVVLWQSTLLWVEAFKAIFAKQKLCKTKMLHNDWHR